MNPYLKRLVDNRIEFLNMEEQEVKESIAYTKEMLAKQEEKLKEIQTEKETLQK
ncbi:hypothetical protein [Lysinibacillus odysseyi]|uniref:hypothetical protein n=1 Tax=Lysinibacillus odysseyi TaxID=202611 RepID=UPI000A849FFF|nr:hypothetical protein [Lysinibacillus odysseyi]